MGTKAKTPGRRGKGVEGPNVVPVYVGSPPLPATCNALLTKRQICFAISVSLRQFHKMLSAGDFPRHDAVVGSRGQLPRWQVGTLNAWIDNRCKPKEE
jgi:predicted DNA-binding transcriptional regulator AlpA